MKILIIRHRKSNFVDDELGASASSNFSYLKKQRVPSVPVDAKEE